MPQCLSEFLRLPNDVPLLSRHGASMSTERSVDESVGSAEAALALLRTFRDHLTTLDQLQTQLAIAVSRQSDVSQERAYEEFQSARSLAPYEEFQSARSLAEQLAPPLARLEVVCDSLQCHLGGRRFSMDDASDHGREEEASDGGDVGDVGDGGNGSDGGDGSHGTVDCAKVERAGSASADAEVNCHRAARRVVDSHEQSTAVSLPSPTTRLRQWVSRGFALGRVTATTDGLSANHVNTSSSIVDAHDRSVPG